MRTNRNLLKEVRALLASAGFATTFPDIDQYRAAILNHITDVCARGGQGVEMKLHDLKIDPEPFEGVIRGVKTNDMRLDDRGYEVGDILVLRETKYSSQFAAHGAPVEYTGRAALREISHIQRGYGLAGGWAILSFASYQNDRPESVEHVPYAWLESMYYDQCRLTDKFAAKAEEHGDLALRARIAELESDLATMNRRFVEARQAVEEI